MPTIQSRRILITGALARRLPLGHLAAGLVALGLFSSACTNRAEEEKRIAEIQKKADERVAQVERDSKQKVEALEKKMEGIKAEAAAASAQAKADADSAISKAEASVEEATKAVEAALKKAREAYKEEARTELANLNKELTELTSKAAKTPAKSKEGYDTAFKDAVARQKEVTKDIAAYDQATLETFKATKAKLDRDLALMKAALKTARTKLPK